MSQSGSNPYQPPTSPKGPIQTGVPQGDFQVDHLKNFTFLFDSPNWLANLAFCTLAMLVPVVGPIVLLGYQYEICEFKIRMGGGQYPDFDFNRLGAYLSRGIWPFLVMLVAGLALTPLFLGIYLVFFVMLASIGERGAEALALIPMIFFSIAMMGLGLIFAVVSQPMVTRAALTQDFVQGFNFRFVFDYLGKVWQQLLLGMALIVILSPILAFAGLIVLCVGYLIALTIINMAYGHLNYQCYRLYLSRGGEPIPFKQV